MTTPSTYFEWIVPVSRLAVEAGELILRHYTSGFTHEHKADNTPVTIADREANALIVAGLARLTPDIPIVSEEGEQPQMTDRDRFWLVDPLDGTRSFVARDGEFTVNIALIDQGEPVLGVMLVPVTGELYHATQGGRACKVMDGVERVIETRVPDPAGYDIVVSKSHHSPKTDHWLANVLVRNRIPAGSALKLTRVAEGAADLYPRLGATMEWDIAAGHCILEAAGGVLTTLDGAPFRYGKEGYRNGPFIASGDALSNF